MRTNVVIDDDLMRQALVATGLKTKREVVEEGLRVLVRAENRAGILALRGTVTWDGDLDDMRTDKIR